MNRNCIKSRRDKCPLADDCYGLTDDDDDCKCRLADYNKGRAEAIDEVKRLIKIRLINNLSLENVTKYGNRDTVQQANSYSTVMKYEIADCIDDLFDDLEQLKEKKNEQDNSDI